MQNEMGIVNIEGHTFKINAITYIGPLDRAARATMEEMVGGPILGEQENLPDLGVFNLIVDQNKMTIAEDFEKAKIIRNFLHNCLCISEPIPTNVSDIPSFTEPVLVEKPPEGEFPPSGLPL